MDERGPPETARESVIPVFEISAGSRREHPRGPSVDVEDARQALVAVEGAQVRDLTALVDPNDEGGLASRRDRVGPDLSEHLEIVRLRPVVEDGSGSTSTR
jgi:hypothetical protein